VTVEGILEAKGRGVETIAPRATVAMAVRELATKSIGVLVVSTDGEHVEGVISERDIVRALARLGTVLLGMRVSEVMSTVVPVCSPQATTKEVMAQMTTSRQRHLPVVDGRQLCGIVSIGDVVKNRLEELELETVVLREAYIAHR
jgi:CBS domain-containing protein